MPRIRPKSEDVVVELPKEFFEIFASVPIYDNNAEKYVLLHDLMPY